MAAKVPRMLTAEVNGQTFAYYDTGAPKAVDYTTLIIVHGNTYHAGTFFTLLPPAPSLNLRVILVQRRLYPGSSSYTEKETAIVMNGTEAERKALLDRDGELLALFVDNMIQVHSLNKVAVIGWSAGTCYLHCIVDAIKRVNDDARSRLQQHIQALIYWDPPSSVSGLEDPPTGGWIPLYDTSLTPEQRGEAFGKWLSYHYPHPDLEKRDPTTLIYKLDKPIKPPSFSNLTMEQFFTMIDLTANPRGDVAVGSPYYKPYLLDRYQRALLDPEVRKLWTNAKFGCIYGDQSPYNVQWAIWCWEKDLQNVGLDMHFIDMKESNHFVMSDDPELTLKTIKSLLA
ncbi:Alpha/Beta hydrolase protein [Lentinula raphanica]|nr:Alpha/Beta hydrolase protein [Lentinula raphanica]